MQQTRFFEKFLSKLAERYPEAANSIQLNERLGPTLFCPEAITLPATVAEQAKEISRAFYALRELPERKTQLENESPATPDPGNSSALMSYDYHIDKDGQLRLIEINTNASMALMSDHLYQIHGTKNYFSDDFQKEIVDTFREEYRLAFPGKSEPKRVVIVDAKPEEQKLFAEFVMYRELFRRAGWNCEIADPSELSFSTGQLTHQGQPVDLIYNRHTDFYFETSETGTLRQAMMSKAACISPHPHEYRLLADKVRLLELSQPGLLESLELSEENRRAIDRALIKTIDMGNVDPAQIWSERKNLFFKPKRMYGGKSAYRGASISRSVFERMLSPEFVAQQFVPAPTLKLADLPDQEFKFDLRFFAYKDKIQSACARLYQGQMTNSQTPGGGLAAIQFV